MESDKKIMYTTLLLAGIAGFCDTVTFVAVDELFSAHVTGNFIVFAYDLIRTSDLSAWARLITFPVFVIAVLFGGVLSKRMNHTYTLLILEGAILLFCGLAASLLQVLLGADQSMIISYTIAFAIVFAMGLQNAFGKLFGKETYGPTTMMTGNVTQASLEFGEIIKNKFSNKEQWVSLRKTLTSIVGFLCGCLLGAIGGGQFGLSSVLFPGLVLLFFLIFAKNR